MRRTSHRLRVLEAALALALAGLALRLLPFRLVVGLAGARLAHMDAGATEILDPAPHDPGTSDPAAAAVGRAVRAAARRLPWRPVCLPQALAAALMLRRRGVRSTLWFGVRHQDGAVRAHAWLHVADGVVCGGEARGFVPIAVLAVGTPA